MENITLKEILTIYWSQFTLLLFSVGYIIKIYIESKQKKSEINHNLLQQRKLDALNHYFFLYSKIHQMWYDFHGYSIKDKRLTANELDELIIIPLNQMKSSVLELKLYFEKNITDDFEKISINFFKINGLLKPMYLNYDVQKLTPLVQIFENGKDEKLAENEKIILQITYKIKQIFK